MLAEPSMYTVARPFMPARNGRGLDISADASGKIYPLPPAAAGCQVFQAFNDGAVAYWIVFGDEPDIAGIPVPAGERVTYAMPADGGYTHLSVKTREGVTTGTITFGA